MKGQVVSFIVGKNYGFIKGDDGESYFFHLSSLKDKSSKSKVTKNAYVLFDPSPTPKGNAAKNISILDTFYRKRLVPFFVTKEASPKHGEIEQHHALSTPYYDDPNEAREYLKLMAMTVGCNAILNFHIRRETFSEGNYNYTMHAALGTLALISELVPCSSEAEVEEGEEEIREAIAQFDTNFSIVNERETKIRYNQEGWPVPRWFVPGLIIAAFILLSVIGIGN